MTKERQHLSVDLADRSDTIKKLLEDNRELKERLQLAQKEAANYAAEKKFATSNMTYYDTTVTKDTTPQIKKGKYFTPNRYESVRTTQKYY